MSKRMRELFRIFQGAWRVARQPLCRMVPMAACGLGLAACSLSVPLPGFTTDDSPTGSIKAAGHSDLSAEMDPEDWRRAKSALATALDPQGNGAGVAWDNPQSGSKGLFIPVAQAFPKGDGICRAFSAKLNLKGMAERAIRSSACRRNGEEWVIGPVHPAEHVARSAPRKNDNLAERDTNTQLN